jgi:hypothetical protein
MSMPVGQTTTQRLQSTQSPLAGSLALPRGSPRLDVVADHQRVVVDQRGLQAAVGADGQAQLLAKPREVEVDDGAHGQHPREGLTVRAGPALDHVQQGRQRGEVAEHEVAHQERRAQEDRVLEHLAPELVEAHRPLIATHAHVAWTFDEALDGAEDTLEEHRVRAGIAAPDAAVECGHHEEREADAAQHEEREPEVLRVHAEPEQEEAPVLNVEEHRWAPPHLNERQRHVDGDQDREHHPSAGHEAPRHIGGVHVVAPAVRAQRAGRFVDHGELALGHDYSPWEGAAAGATAGVGAGSVGAGAAAGGAAGAASTTAASVVVVTPPSSVSTGSTGTPRSPSA